MPTSPVEPKRTFIPIDKFSSIYKIILFYLRCTGSHFAIPFVRYADDPFWCNLAVGHLKGSRNGAAVEKAFSGAERDRNYHELHLVDQIILEQRLKQVCASHSVYVGSVLLFDLPYF